MAIGVDGSGAAGLINGLASFTGSALAAGILCLITAGLWVGDGLAGLWLWREVRHLYNDAGHTLQSTKNQLVTMGVKSGVAQDIITASGIFLCQI